jgi:hypothetical protein
MTRISHKARDRSSSYIVNGAGCSDDRCSELWLGCSLLKLWFGGLLLTVGGLFCNRSMLG